MNKDQFENTLNTLRRTNVLRKDKNVITEEFKMLFLENVKRFIQTPRECISKALMRTLLEWYNVLNEDQMSDYFLVLNSLMNTEEMTRRIIEYGV